MQTPEQTIATLAAVGVGVVLLIRAGRWFFSGPLKPDPWSEQMSVALDEPESTPVCHRCLTEQSGVAHFCPHCGASVGECNNLLPFEQIFSEGEVFRNGATLTVRPSFLVIAGYLLLSLMAYMIFAPVFWYFLFQNMLRRREPPEIASNA